MDKNQWKKLFLIVSIALLAAGVILLATSIGFSASGKTEKLAIVQSNMAAAKVVVGGVFIGFGLLIACLASKDQEE